MFKLAAGISRISWSPDSEQRIREGLSALHRTGKEEEFLTYCKRWKLAPWSYVQLRNRDMLGSLSHSVTGGLHQEYKKVRQENESRAAAVEAVLGEFFTSGIDVAILKGSYFAETIYRDSGYKRMNDFDMLIRKEDWNRVQQIYLDLGFIPLGFGWGGEKEKPARFSHVGMSYISPDFKCILGTQWGLKSPTTIYKNPGLRLWDTAVPFEFRGTKARALSAEFNLLHLILHMEVYKCGIRDCMDLYNLMISSEIDLDQMRQVLQEANASEKARFTLELCNLCSREFPEEFLKSLEAAERGYLYRRRSLRKRMAKETGDFQASYHDWFHEIEKEVIWFNLFPLFHRKTVHFFRILKKVFIANRDVRLKLIDRSHRPSVVNRIRGTLCAPFLIMALTAQEIGWLFTLLLLFKLFLDLPVSLLNYFFKKESYLDYLKRNGIDQAHILQAVNNIQ